jgi:hypothetical protein
MKIEGKIASPKVNIKSKEDKTVSSKLSFSNNWITLILKSKDTINPSINRLTGYVENTSSLSGKAILNYGKEVSWSAIKTAPFVNKEEVKAIKKAKKAEMKAIKKKPYMY